MLPELLPAGVLHTKEWWEKERRPRILELFETYVYGRTPKEPLDRMESSVIQTECLMEGKVKKETVYLKLEKNGRSCGFHCRVFSPLPQKSEELKSMPAILMINPFSRNKELDYPGKELDHMPYDLITSMGFIGVHADVDEICADDSRIYREGLWELYPGEGDRAWGAIGMWAYAASRVIDYLMIQKHVEYGKIAVCGCSRAGKTALWCGVQDQRAGLVISNVSGCAGAAITRGKTGEQIRDITTQFPHWMCPMYASFADREEELPVDQHMLLALCAPRPLYVSSASEDVWADPYKEFESAQAAGAVYKLYGKKGLEDQAFPAVNTPIGTGAVAYHNRQGIHGCRRYDWEQYLGFIKRFSD